MVKLRPYVDLQSKLDVLWAKYKRAWFPWTKKRIMDKIIRVNEDAGLK